MSTEKLMAAREEAVKARASLSDHDATSWRPFTVDIQAPSGGSCLVKINGALVVEHCLTPMSRDGLQEEVSQARAAQAACNQFRSVLKALEESAKAPDHNHKTEKAKMADFAEGLEAGLRGLVVEHPEQVSADAQSDAAGMPRTKPGQFRIPPMMPRYTPSYERGYRLGAGIRLAVACSAPTPMVAAPPEGGGIGMKAMADL